MTGSDKKQQGEKLNNRFKPFSATFLIVVVCFILCISMVSALDLDNKLKIPTLIKNLPITIGDKELIYNSIWGKYEPIEIVNWLGLGSTLFSGAITQHDETCGINCKSTMQIYLANDGILVDNIIFKTLQEDNSWIEQNVRGYQFSYWGISDDYETQCVELKEVCNEILNESYCYIPKECFQVKIGSHEGWINYNLGKKVKAGTYELKLNAQKKPSRTVDWIIKTNGKWLDSWATWGNISAGDDAEVILNSPADDEIAYVPTQTFNCSANISDGATIENMSLWTNESGSWDIRNTSTYNDNWTMISDLFGNSGNPELGLKIYTETNFAESIMTYWNNSGDFAYLKNEAGTIIYENITVENHWANFTYQLLPSTIYRIISATGVSYNQKDIGDGDSRETSQEGLFKIGSISASGNIFNIIKIKIGDYNLTTFSETWDTTISDTIIWNVQACDSDGDCGFATSNYTVILDTTSPAITVHLQAGL